MGQKLDLHDDCADRLKILADPTRLEVMRQLMEGPRRVSELNHQICIEQSLLSHHLRVLRDAGLVSAERDGKSMLYRLAETISPEASGKTINLGCCEISFDRNV